MDEPRAEQVAQAVADTLAGISRAAGFWTDLGRNISRRRYLVTDLDRSKMPCASVWAGDSVPVPGCLGGTKQDRLIVLVEFWARADRAEDLDRELLRAQADVRGKVMATKNLALTFIARLEPGRVKSDHQEFADNKIGWKAVAFEVDYKWAAATP